jgi:proteasome accessory factor B
LASHLRRHAVDIIAHVTTGDTMAPLERLLNLVGLLLETQVPLTFEQIKETLEPYRRQKPESAKRMFERDKDTLREFGIPLTMSDTDVWGSEQGYVIPKDLYYLPDVEFSPEELAALLVAAQSGGVNPPAEQAARKLLYGADGGVLAGLAGGPLASGSDARLEEVLAAADSARRRRRVGFGYRNARGEVSEREVDAYAVVFRGGHWYLVGHDHSHEEIRAFRLSRFTTAVSDLGEGDEPPSDFRASDSVQGGPWVASGDELARVAFAPHIAWTAENTFTGAVREQTRRNGWVVMAIPMPEVDSMAALVVQFGPDAEALEPWNLRSEVIRRLEAVR